MTDGLVKNRESLLFDKAAVAVPPIISQVAVAGHLPESKDFERGIASATEAFSAGRPRPVVDFEGR